MRHFFTLNFNAWHLMKRLIITILALLPMLVACNRNSNSSEIGKAYDIDLDSIVQRKKLYVVTDYNSVDYFVHKGTVIGYQYELVNEYAKHLNIEVELIASNDIEKNVEMLQSGRVDLIATNLIADTINEHRYAFAEPYGRSHLVLVQRNSDQKITELPMLAGDTISVLDKSFYESTLRNINDTTDMSLCIDEIEYYDVEQIIQLVAESEIKYTISLENIARANKWFYPNIDISFAISDEYDLSWAMRHESIQLKADIDLWLKEFKKTPRFKQIYRKYFIDPRDHHNEIQKTTSDTYQADYERIIKAVATDERYNWRLISAVIYQESHFNANAKSWAGACGLMQLMPETAERFGVDDPTDPEQNITAGVRYLLWLDSRLTTEVPDPTERVSFTLAAYNVGLGHIMDAFRLAKKFGLDTLKWRDNVEVALLHKSNPAFYSDPVVKHGYCRGTETINYVRNIIDRYHNYQREIVGKNDDDVNEISEEIVVPVDSIQD